VKLSLFWVNDFFWWQMCRLFAAVNQTQNLIQNKMKNYTAIYENYEYAFQAENFEAAKLFCENKFCCEVVIRNDDKTEIQFPIYFSYDERRLVKLLSEKKALTVSTYTDEIESNCYEHNTSIFFDRYVNAKGEYKNKLITRDDFEKRLYEVIENFTNSTCIKIENLNNRNV